MEFAIGMRDHALPHLTGDVHYRERLIDMVVKIIEPMRNEHPEETGRVTMGIENAE